MKKFFQLASIAVVAAAMLVACNNKKAPEEPIIDSLPVDSVIDTLDTIEEVAEEIVAEEPVKTQATAKKSDEGIKKANASNTEKNRNSNTISQREKAAPAEVQATEKSESSTKNASEAQKRTNANANSIAPRK